MYNSLSRKQKRAHLLNICRQCHRTRHLKRAAVDGSTTAFETAFANLATANLQDKAPGLLDKLLGFELIEKSDENDRAIGVFGFKVGEQLLYAPVFFLNGELKGDELLYMAGTDSFVPMDEKWVNYLMNRKPITIGKPVSQQNTRRNIATPSFDMFKELPTKYGSALADWSLEGVAGLLTATEGYTQPALMADKLVEKSAAAAKRFLQIIDAYPTLLDPIVQCYGNGIVDKAVNCVKSASLININNLPTTKKQASALQIFTDFCDNDDLSPDDKLEIRRKGYLIKDAREQASVVYKTQEELSLQSPDKTGLYDVLCKPAIFERCFVSLAPVGVQNTTDARKLVIKINSPVKWKSTSSPDLLTSEEDLVEEYKKWLKGLPTTRTISSGNSYILISNDGKNSTTVFTVDAVIGTNGGKTFNIYWSTNADYSNPRNRIMPVEDYAVDSAYNYRDSWQNRINKLTLSDKVKDFVVLGDTLLVPKDVKVFKLKTAEKPTDSDACTPCNNINIMDSDELPLANQSDIKLLIIKNSSELKVHTDRYEAYVNDKRFSLKEALFHLVKVHGLREKVAKELLLNKGGRYRIKYALNPYHLQGPGVATEWGDEIPTGNDTFFGSDMPVSPSQEQVLPFADMQGFSPDELEANELTQEEDIRRQLGQAQQTGQKEVFDTQMLGTLLNTSREKKIIDDYLPALVKGLDATARLLFNMYWHNDQFIDRFGEREIEEIEEALKNTFSQLGDLTMALKKREVGPRADEGLDVDLAALGSE